MEDNIYLQLTREFNEGKVRAVISSGQAVVLHRLAIMSKDGDWILREEEEALQHVLSVLERHGARYRLGAPLDLDWLKFGWSSHFEFAHSGLRIRADFFTRQPRLSEKDRESLWEGDQATPPFLPLRPLADVKKTMRAKDYSVIGELARRMEDPRDKLFYARSADDLIAISKENPSLVDELADKRDVLKLIAGGRDVLDEALLREQLALMREDERRIKLYADAAASWRKMWPSLEARTAKLTLRETHTILTEEAGHYLPQRVL